MKLIILDHFRRWWWAWAVGAVTYGAELVGVCIANPTHHDFSSFFPLGFFLGAFLLSFDLQRGHTRTLLAMPVSVNQIARAWWWVSVGIPILIFAGVSAVVLGMLFLIGVSGYAMPSVQWINGIFYWLVNAMLLGTMFFALTGMSAKPVGTLVWPDYIRRSLFGVIWGGAILIWLFLKDFNSYAGYGTLVLFVAFALSILSWFRAERLVHNRGGLGNNPAPSPGSVTNPSRCAEGSGGLLFLGRVIFLRMTGVGLFMYLGFAAILQFMGGEASDPGHLKTFFPMYTIQFLWVMCFQLTPVITHIRFLRTLPVSASRVASALVLTTLGAMVSVMYAANLVMAALYHSVPFTPLEMVHQGCFLEIAIMLIFVPVIVRRGLGAMTVLSGMVVIIAAMFSMHLATPYLSNPANIALSVFFIFSSLVATKLVLERCSTTYRPRANQPGTWQLNFSR